MNALVDAVFWLAVLVFSGAIILAGISMVRKLFRFGRSIFRGSLP